MNSNLGLVRGAIPGIYLKVLSKTIKTYPMSQLSQREVSSQLKGTNDSARRAVHPEQWRQRDLYGL